MICTLAVAVAIPASMGAGIAVAGPLTPVDAPLPPSTVPLPVPEGEDGQVGTHGTTTITGGWLTAVQDWFSHKQSFGTKSGFSSIFGVKSPRLQVRILDSSGNVIEEQNRSWDNTRYQETIWLNHHLPRPAGSVCTTLWEGGHQLNTACEAIQ